jgi:hypothetical protein
MSASIKAWATRGSCCSSAETIEQVRSDLEEIAAAMAASGLAHGL